MDNKRLILFSALFVTLYFIWVEWGAWQQAKNAPATPAAIAGAPAAPTAPTPPAGHVPATSDVPTASAPAARPAPAAPAVARGTRITLKSDVLSLVIDTVGGDVRCAHLLQYPAELNNKNEPVDIFTDGDCGPGTPADEFYVAQSGLASSSGQKVPNHYDHFTAKGTDFALAPGQKSVSTTLTWNDGKGLVVDKTFTLKRGSYVVDVSQVVHNGSGAPLSVADYRQLQRTPPVHDTHKKVFIHTYTGAVIYTPEDKYQKIDFDDMAKHSLSRSVKNGWIAMLQHYFLSAWIPPRDTAETFYSKVVDGNHYIIGTMSAPVTVAPGAAHTFDTGMFVGPKRQDHLAQVAPGFDLTVDYGRLTFLAKPIFWLLEKLHALLGNWGWSIILLTVLIKAAFYKLSKTSYKSMAHMKKMGPRMKALKERYGDDKQRYQQAMMEMYKKEKINPLGGCLPILVQIPVFIALYWVLVESVELRQAPWIFWIHDLSTKDPYFVLPVIMGVTMFLQQRLNPSMADPMQQKVMMLLPFVFTFFFAFFPSGLVLYWVVNNTLSVAQQWHITRQIAREGH